MSAKRLVIKLGTQVVLEEQGAWNSEGLGPVLEAAIDWKRSGHELLLVSSGAVGLGRNSLGLKGELSLVQKQVCAAVGQTELVEFYKRGFEKEGVRCAQVLVSAWDFMHRSSYLRLKSCLEAMLEIGVVPIINENDSVAVSELQEKDKSFGDNDKLSAIVSSKMNADGLLILTRVEGLMSDHKRVPVIHSLSELRKIQEDPSLKPSTNEEGRGGLRTKIEAASLSAMSGVRVVIGCGHQKLPSLQKLFDKDSEIDFGTRIEPISPLNQKKRWVASSGLAGAVWVNAGALEALYERTASLLPVGITRYEGDFKAGQVVHIFDDYNREWARGLCRMSSSELDSSIGQKNAGEFVHRDELVLLGDLEEWKSRSKT